MNIHSILCQSNLLRLTKTGLIGLLLIFASPPRAEELLVPEPWPAPAPPFHLQDLEGDYRHLGDFRGRVLVVNFWASWCQPCRQELPSMNRASAVLEQDEVAMLAVNLGEEPEAVEAFLNDFPIDFPVLIDQRGIYSQRWGVRALPTTFVLNPRGEIVYRILGEKVWDDPSLLAQVRQLAPRRAKNLQGLPAIGQP